MIKHGGGGGQVLVGDVGQSNEAKKSFPNVDVGDKCDKTQLYLKSFWGNEHPVELARNSGAWTSVYLFWPFLPLSSCLGPYLGLL